MKHIKIQYFYYQIYNNVKISHFQGLTFFIFFVPGVSKMIAFVSRLKALVELKNNF